MHSKQLLTPEEINPPVALDTLVVEPLSEELYHVRSISCHPEQSEGSPRSFALLRMTKTSYHK